MHYAVMEDKLFEEAARERDLAVKLAKLAGVADPERRVEPEMSASLVFGDPHLAELFRRAARNDLMEEAVAKLESVEPDTSEAPLVSLEEIDGIGPEVADQLYALGYRTPEDLESASDEELLEVAGIGPAKLAQIREQL